MENALLGLKPGQEQLVWLIDFQNWNMSSVSVKVTRETARILQNCYPERLAFGILYNPPKVFESFWLVRFDLLLIFNFSNSFFMSDWFTYRSHKKVLWSSLLYKALKWKFYLHIFSARLVALYLKIWTAKLSLHHLSLFFMDT